MAAVPTTDQHRAAGHPLVLVAVWDESVGRIIRERLDREDLETAGASVHDLASAAARVRPDLLIVGLPQGAFLDDLARVRTLVSAPMIAVVPAEGQYDCVEALEMGADDALDQPFSPRELAARVRAVLRRGAPSLPHQRLDFGALTIDPDAREVTVDGEVVAMPSREFDLLHFMARSPRRVYTREQLLSEVWRSSTDWQDPATVTEHIRRIRRRIESDPRHPRWIVTVWSVGYRFEP